METAGLLSSTTLQSCLHLLAVKIVPKNCWHTSEMLLSTEVKSKAKWANPNSRARLSCHKSAFLTAPSLIPPNHATRDGEIFSSMRVQLHLPRQFANIQAVSSWTPPGEMHISLFWPPESEQLTCSTLERRPAMHLATSSL